MRYAIFSDVHGNLPALDEFVKYARNIVDAYICLGDTVNYGPWNDECIEVIYSLPGIIFLEGNHERIFSGSNAIEKQLPIVRAFYFHSYKYFSKFDLIENLQTVHSRNGVVFTHTINDQKIFPNTLMDINHDYFIGHNHYQFISYQDDKRIISCGSIGQNRQSICEVNFIIYDTLTNIIELKTLDYPINLFISELKSRKFSSICIDYYVSKI